jgi:hypothetical protein
MRQVNLVRFVNRIFYALIIVCVLFSSTVLVSQPKPVYAQAVDVKVSAQYPSLPGSSADSSKPGVFGKHNPANGATGIDTTVTLQWGSGTKAVSYEYCIDKSNNDACNGSWINTGTDRTVELTGLTYNKTYYWQVRAINSKGKTYANDNTWYSFTTNIARPGAFGKSGPADKAKGLSIFTTLTWTASSQADKYEYCIDDTNNNSCHGNWISTGTDLKAKLTNLSHNKAYYWAVRAVNGAGKTYADGNTWWSFKTKK